MHKKILQTKTGNRTIVIFSAVLLCLAIVCSIINFSIDHSLSWSLYPAGALVVVWATLAPLMVMKKNKATGMVSGFAITIIPFLFLIQYLVPAKGWLIPLALPIVILTISALALCLLFFTFVKVNKLYGAAVTVFLFGVLVNFGVGKIVDGFLNERNRGDIYNALTLSASVVLALILFIMGYVKRSKANFAENQ